MIVITLLLIVGLTSAAFVSRDESAAMVNKQYDQFVQAAIASLTQAQQELEQKKNEKQVLRANPDAHMEALANIYVSVQRTLQRGSAMFNSGHPDLCARLYYQSMSQIAQLLQKLGENDAVQFFATTLNKAAAERSADKAAWILRKSFDQFLSSMRQSSFGESQQFQAVQQIQQENVDVGCAFGLMIQQRGDEIAVFEVRSQQGCNDQIEPIDASFFVEEQESCEEEEEEQTEEVKQTEDQTEYEVDEFDDYKNYNKHHFRHHKHGCTIGLGLLVFTLSLCLCCVVRRVRRRRRCALARRKGLRVVYGGKVTAPSSAYPFSLNTTTV